MTTRDWDSLSEPISEAGMSVFRFADGRVALIQTYSSGGSASLIAVFESEDLDNLCAWWTERRQKDDESPLRKYRCLQCALYAYPNEGCKTAHNGKQCPFLEETE